MEDVPRRRYPTDHRLAEIIPPTGKGTCRRQEACSRQCSGRTKVGRPCCPANGSARCQELFIRLRAVDVGRIVGTSANIFSARPSNAAGDEPAGVCCGLDSLFQVRCMSAIFLAGGYRLAALDCIWDVLGLRHNDTMDRVVFQLESLTAMHTCRRVVFGRRGYKFNWHVTRPAVKGTARGGNG